MEINELEAEKKVNNLIGVITSLDSKQETPTGKTMQEGILTDDTGQVKITLWEEQVGVFKEGDKVSVVSGWCKEFEGELQISTGKFGKMHKIPEKKVD